MIHKQIIIEHCGKCLGGNRPRVLQECGGGTSDPAWVRGQEGRKASRRGEHCAEAQRRRSQGGSLWGEEEGFACAKGQGWEAEQCVPPKLDQEAARPGFRSQLCHFLSVAQQVPLAL